MKTAPRPFCLSWKWSSGGLLIFLSPLRMTKSRKLSLDILSGVHHIYYTIIILNNYILKNVYQNYIFLDYIIIFLIVVSTYHVVKQCSSIYGLYAYSSHNPILSQYAQSEGFMSGLQLGHSKDDTTVICFITLSICCERQQLNWTNCIHWTCNSLYNFT